MECEFQMYIVKISTDQFPECPKLLLRQTPGGKGIWDNVMFFVNDDSIKSCDYWIVYYGLLKKEVAFCPKENVILITGEPPSIQKYNEQYLTQFNKVITCHKDMEHENKIIWQQALAWFIGTREIKYRCKGYTIDYDYLRNKKINPEYKNKICSVISSNKVDIQGQKDRIRFVELLKTHFGDKIDFFGRGFNDFEDKWDAIAPYKYHIVIENSSFDDYWSEKLADAFLGEAYPIYHGANNIYSYFDKDSLTKIDIYNSGQAIKIIEEVINGNYYDKYKHKIIESKNKILDEYNLFPTIISKVILQDVNQKNEKNRIVLTPEVYLKMTLIKKLKFKLLGKKIIKKYWSKYRKLRPKKTQYE